MIKIKDLLEKVNNLMIAGELRKTLAHEVLAKNFNFEIKKEEIEIKNGALFLNIKPIYKNEVFLRKDKVLADLRETIGKNAPKEIR